MATEAALPLSVVVASRNCAGRIEGTVRPWLALAREVIVVDQMSDDGTDRRAEELGCLVIRNEPPDGNFDLNRKLGMQRASSEWILYIDTDERPTPGLLVELRAFLANPAANGGIEGARIPNLFYFLGKPLRHGIYNPRSSEIRLVRQGCWDYPCEKGYHRGVSVKGEVARFKHPYKHFNVNSLSEWFLKTDQYTEHDARASYRSAPARTWSAFWEASRFFVNHYFFRRGFLDGFHGLVAVFYFMLYHLTLRIKRWELGYKDTRIEGEDFLKSIESPRR